MTAAAGGCICSIPSPDYLRLERWTRSMWAAGSLACSPVQVAANLAEFADLVSFHGGWIPERFNDVAEARFCFVHIDVDLLQPTREVLEFFYPRMVAGGLIVCDDYGFDTCPGARHAT